MILGKLAKEKWNNPPARSGAGGAMFCLPEKEYLLPEMRQKPVGVSFSATSAYNRFFQDTYIKIF